METFSALLAFCAGNSPVIGEFPAQRPVTQSLDVYFDLRLNTLLSKQWWGWWFETPSCPLWRYIVITHVFLIYCILLVWAPFYQSLVGERQLFFHLSGINRLITISSWVQIAFWSVVSIIYIYYYNLIAGKINFTTIGIFFSQSLLLSWVLILGCKSIFQPNFMMQYSKVQWVFFSRIIQFSIKLSLWTIYMHINFPLY